MQVRRQLIKFFSPLEIFPPIHTLRALLLRILTLHERNHGLTHIEWCTEIRSDVCFPLRSGGFIFHCAVSGVEKAAGDARIVNQYIDAATEELCGLRDGSADFVGLGEIRDMGAYAGRVGGEVRGDCVVEFFGVEVEDEDAV